MKKLSLSLALAALWLGPLAPAAQAWGVVGHRAITQVAVYELPTAMQVFYFRHLPQLVHLSSVPDERRSASPAEFSKHYIMLDHYSEENPFAKMPRDYDKAVDKFSADTVRKYGTLPWAVMEAKDKLVAAFNARDTTAIMQSSAELSNLTADIFAPLHTTVDYNGQLTGQTDIQYLWESQMPDKFIQIYKWAGEESHSLKTPLESLWQELQRSYGFLSATFDTESQVSKAGFTPQTKYTYSHRYGRTQRRYSDAFVEDYHKEIGGQLAYRLKGAAPLVASMWLTAWQEAGRPDLSSLMASPKLSNEERQALDAQLKSWKENTLAQDQLLLALQKEKKAIDPDDIKAAEGEAVAPPAPEPAAAEAAPAATKVKVKTKTAAGTEKQKTKP